MPTQMFHKLRTKLTTFLPLMLEAETAECATLSTTQFQTASNVIMERSLSHIEFFNCELQILHHY